MYLVGNPAGKVLDGELWDGHLWLLIEWVVAMVIVTLLEKSVVCRLATKQSTLSDMYNDLTTDMFRFFLGFLYPTCGKKL